MPTADWILGIAWAFISIFIVKFAFKITSFVLCRLTAGAMDVRTTGSWAIVTGPTKGLGLSFALALAKKGLNIVLVCQKGKEDPRELAKEIEKTHLVKTKTIQVDFTDDEVSHNKFPNFCKSLQKSEIMDLDVGVLVNCVGMTGDCFLDTDHATFVRRVVAHNKTSTEAMTNLFLPGMVQRKKGAIINTSCRIVELHPVKIDYVFVATRDFVRTYTEDLNNRLKETGVVAQALVPGYVPRLPAWIRPTEAQYVDSAIASLGVHSVTGGYWLHDLLLFLLESDFFMGSRIRHYVGSICLGINQ